MRTDEISEKYCNEMWKGELTENDLFAFLRMAIYRLVPAHTHTAVCRVKRRNMIQMPEKQVNKSAWIGYAVSGHSLAADDKKIRICIYSLSMQNGNDFF